MIQYPLQFSVQSEATSGIAESWKTTVPHQSLSTAIPPEFEGKGNGFSPEDYFAMALINCFVATFKVVAEKSKLDFGGLKADGKLTVDRNDQGVPMMKAFHFSVHLSGAADPERARRLLEKTSSMCLIHQSVKTVITTEFIVN